MKGDRIVSYSEMFLKLFKEKTVVTFDEVKREIGCSRTTFVKLIGNEGYYSSCNKNGKYYILAKACNFNELGLFMYNGIMFSKFKTLKLSILNMVEKSEKGLTSQEITDIFGTNSKALLSALHTSKQISRFKVGGAFIYLSNDSVANTLQQSIRQLEEESKIANILKEELPSNEIIIAILTVLATSNKKLTAKQVMKKLKKKKTYISKDEIKKVMLFYKVSEKKTLRSC